MTDRDEPSKGFLERWSRKKIDAEREAPAKAGAKDVSSPAEVRPSERQATNDAETPARAAPKPEFDLTSLPSLDSITAVTDIRAFLNPSVPTDLARAALRRAWAADPAIRDFKGLAENDWDFTDPTAMPGFGALPPGYDVKKLVAQIFGDGEKPADPEVAEGQPPIPQAPIAQQIAPPAAAAEPEPSSEAEAASGAAKISEGGQQVAHSDVVQRNNITASHNSNADDDTEEPKNRRQHGGALPQ
jgi:hypothetical protein